MQALVEVITEGGLSEFSVQQVADRAGVAHRTVYRHFPTREALLEALTEWAERRMGFADGVPVDTASLPATVERNYRTFEAHSSEMEAMVRLGVGASAQPRRRRRRTDAFSKVIRADFPDADDDAIRVAAAMVRVLASGRTWLNLREAGLDGDEAATAAGWAVGVLLDALAAGHTPTATDHI